jgi:hypothetical protein
MVNPINQLKPYNLESSAVNSVSRLLGRIRKGSDTVLRTPFLKDESAEEILTRFNSEVVDGSEPLETKLMEMEMSNRSKFGPRSRAKPWVDRRRSVQSYFAVEQWWKGDPRTLDPSDEILGHLSPTSLNSVKSRVLRSANSGLPYLTRKGDVIDDTVEHLDEQLDAEYPCMLFTRTQEDWKTRTVWGYPFADVLQEQTFYVPFLNLARLKSFRAALIGPDEVNRRIHELIHYALSKGLKLVGVDFSSYDQTISPALQAAAFHYIRRHFMSNRSEGLLEVAKRFRTIGLITPEGILSGDHGVPSGSTWTNEVDSVVQHLIAETLFGEEEDSDGSKFYQIQGDDGAYAVKQPERLFERFRSYGLSVNEEKSDVSDSYLVYLQNYFSPTYIRNGIISGVYPVYRALNRLVHLERWTNISDSKISGRDFFSIRAISILENCKHHPWFEKLVKFVVKHDRDSLDFSRASVSEYVRTINSRSSHGVVNQYSDHISGLERFDTVKLIKSL